MTERVKQNLINSINMLPENDKAFTYLKEMCIDFINNSEPKAEDIFAGSDWMEQEENQLW